MRELQKGLPRFDGRGFYNSLILKHSRKRPRVGGDIEKGLVRTGNARQTFFGNVWNNNELRDRLSAAVPLVADFLSTRLSLNLNYRKVKIFPVPRT